MKNHFLFDLLSALSNTELRRFQKFVASPYFNSKEQLVRLCQFFVDCLKNGIVPIAESGFARIFSKEKFNAQKWRLACSQLYKLAEHFLAIEENGQDANFPKMPLSKAYRKKGLDKHYLRTLNSLEKNRDEMEECSVEYYEDQYRLEWERYHFLSTGNRTAEFNLQEIADAMDTAFIARKLRHACVALAHQAVFKKEYDLGLLDAVIKKISTENAYLDNPTIGLYYYAFLSLNDNKEEHYKTFNQRLLQDADQLPKEEQRNLFLLAINLCIRQINAAKPEYDRPMMALYKTALEKDLLLVNSRLSHFTFINIVAIAVRIGETDWVEQFILKYIKTLEKKHRNITFSLSMARLEHARKNYKEALLFLQKSDYKDFINNIIAKTLQLKIYFETDEYEVLESHLRNMKTYIQRQRAFGYHRENYLKIIRFTRALVEMNPFEKAEKKKLKAEIEAAGRLTERDWLLKMLG